MKVQVPLALIVFNEHFLRLALVYKNDRLHLKPSVMDWLKFLSRLTRVLIELAGLDGWGGGGG